VLSPPAHTTAHVATTTVAGARRRSQGRTEAAFR
jgi:hypothetical protein